MRGFLPVLGLFLALVGQVAAKITTAEQFALLAQLPSCATTCLLAATQETPCGTTEFDCQCGDEHFKATAEACVARSCTTVEALFTKNTTQTMCDAPIRNKSFEYKIISTALMTIACATVATRLIYRFFAEIGLGLDDWFIVVVLLCCVPSAAINDVMLADHGLGQDIWTLTPSQITTVATGFWAITLLYFTEVFVLKLCLLFFYLRIFTTHGMRLLLRITVAVDVLYGVAFVAVAVFQCVPISDNWLGWKEGGGPSGGRCVDRSAIAWTHAAISIALDVWMLLLPISGLRKLHMHWKKKAAVALMFAVGTLTTVISLVRLWSLLEFKDSQNLTWDYYDMSMWSSVEVTTGVICACMPALRKMLVTIWPKFDGTMRLRNPLYIEPRETQGGSDSSGAKSKTGGSSTQQSAARAPSKGPRSRVDIELDDVEHLVHRAHHDRDLEAQDGHDTAGNLSVHTTNSREGAEGAWPVSPHAPLDDSLYRQKVRGGERD